MNVAITKGTKRVGEIWPVHEVRIIDIHKKARNGKHIVVPTKHYMIMIDGYLTGLDAADAKVVPDLNVFEALNG